MQKAGFVTTAWHFNAMFCNAMFCARPFAVPILLARPSVYNRVSRRRMAPVPKERFCSFTYWCKPMLR